MLTPVSRDVGISRNQRLFTRKHGQVYQNFSGRFGERRVSCRVLQDSSGASMFPTMVVHGGVLGGILYGIVSTWKPQSSTIYIANRRENRFDIGDREEGFETAVKWSVMSILSCVPYVNYMAWVFAALDSSSLSMIHGDEDGRKDGHYWTLAAVYALPYVVDGFHMDAFTLLTLSLGVLHVQIERGLYYGDLNSWFDSTVQSIVDRLSGNSIYESSEIDESVLQDFEDFDRRLDAASSNSTSVDVSE